MITGHVLPVYYPPPPPSRKRTGMLAGTVAVLGVLVSTVAVVLAVGLERGVSGLVASAAEGGHHTYAGWFACRDVDISAAAAILPLTEAEPWRNPREDRREMDNVRQIDCAFDLSEAGAFGTVWVRAVVAEQASDAAMWQRTRVEEALPETSDTIEDLDGPWQEGVLALGTGRERDPDRAAAGAEICVLDHNFQLCVRFHLTSAPDPPAGSPTDHDLADATRQIVEGMLVLAR